MDDANRRLRQWGGHAYFVGYLKTSGLFDRLVQRTIEEMQIFERTRRELEADAE